MTRPILDCSSTSRVISSIACCFQVMTSNEQQGNRSDISFRQCKVPSYPLSICMHQMTSSANLGPLGGSTPSRTNVVGSGDWWRGGLGVPFKGLFSDFSGWGTQCAAVLLLNGVGDHGNRQAVFYRLPVVYLRASYILSFGHSQGGQDKPRAWPALVCEGWGGCGDDKAIVTCILSG
jgi:hypothetical protein